MSKTFLTSMIFCLFAITTVLDSTNAHAQLFRRGRIIQQLRENVVQPAIEAARQQDEVEPSKSTGVMRAATAGEVARDRQTVDAKQNADAPLKSPKPGSVYFDPSTGRYFRVPQPEDRTSDASNRQANLNRSKPSLERDSTIAPEKQISSLQTPWLTAPRPTGLNSVVQDPSQTPSQANRIAVTPPGNAGQLFPLSRPRSYVAPASNQSDVTDSANNFSATPSSKPPIYRQTLSLTGPDETSVTTPLSVPAAKMQPQKDNAQQPFSVLEQID